MAITAAIMVIMMLITKLITVIIVVLNVALSCTRAVTHRATLSPLTHSPWCNPINYFQYSAGMKVTRVVEKNRSQCWKYRGVSVHCRVLCLGE